MFLKLDALYFLLDQKVPKNQDCKILSKNITHYVERIELAPKYLRISGLRTAILS